MQESPYGARSMDSSAVSHSRSRLFAGMLPALSRGFKEHCPGMFNFLLENARTQRVWAQLEADSIAAAESNATRCCHAKLLHQ